MAGCLGLVFSLQVVAQRPDGPDGPPPPPPAKMEQLKAELGLSDEQATQLEALHKEHRADMRALRQEGTQPDREQMKALRQKHKAGMAEILTEEQMAKMKELRHQKPEGKRMKKAHKQAFKQEILPLMQEQRAKFETMLSETHKQKIEGLRGELAALKPQMKEMRKAKKEVHLNQAAPSGDMDTQFEALREQRKAIFTQAGEIAKAYESELKSLHEEIKPQLEAFHAKMRTQHQSCEDAGIPKPPCETKNGDCKKGRKAEGAIQGKGAHAQGEKGKGRHKDGDFEGKHRLRKAAHFVLMDPNGMVDEMDQEELQLEIFPNPSTTNNTLTYTLRTAGKVTIDLLNKDGQVLKTVFSGNRDAGTFVQQVDTQNLGMDIYYYRVTTADDVIMKRFTVVKQ